MRICRCSFGQRITRTAPTKAIAPTTAFPSAERNRNMPFGPTKSPTGPSPTLRSTWRFIPHGLMQSRVSLEHVQSIHAGVAVMSNQPLFKPYRMGDLDLPNRIVMAPLTRMRSQPHDHVPTTLQAEYYAQRASAGLIITKATAISSQGFGWADTPGLWTKEQVHGWRRVTDAVHAAGGRMIAQLWHTGAISHPELLDGAQPVSASNVDPGQISVTPTGRKPTVTPRPLTKQEIRVTVADFGRAARKAMEAGFDGVQILANYLYLISQFLNATTNRRADEYGGSLENRSRFLFEVVEAVLNAVDVQRVGVKISPMHEGNAFQANDETLPVAEYAIQKLSSYKLSHLLIMGNTTDFSGTPLEKLAGDGMFQHFRPLFNAA